MIGSKVRHYHDGVSVQDLDGDVKDTIVSTLSLPLTSSSIDFVGFFWSTDGLCVFWPKGMKKRSSWHDDARLLVRCLRRAARSLCLDAASANGSSQLEIPVELELLEDYLLNGLFDTRERNFRMSQAGKINWSRTIRQITPLPDSEGNPFYYEQIASFNRNSDGVIRALHSYAVAFADRHFAWLLSPEGKLKAPELSSSQLTLSPRVAVGLIRAELVRQFSDIKKHQLQLLEAFFLKQTKRSGFSGSWLGITSFHTLWEEMCGSYFGDQKRMCPSPAVPAYEVGQSLQQEISNAPKPDVIIYEGDCLAVIDAKYYDFARTRPSWQDLVKQFFYAKAFSHRANYRRIVNALVFPNTDGVKASQALVVDRVSSHRMDAEFSPIKLIFLDVPDVMNHFVNGKVNLAARERVLAVYGADRALLSSNIREATA